MVFKLNHHNKTAPCGMIKVFGIELKNKQKKQQRFSASTFEMYNK